MALLDKSKAIMICNETNQRWMTDRSLGKDSHALAAQPPLPVRPRPALPLAAVAGAAHRALPAQPPRQAARPGRTAAALFLAAGRVVPRRQRRRGPPAAPGRPGVSQAISALAVR